MPYVLPSNPNPDSTQCFQISVPNEPMYIAAFWGALLELCRWYNWERDSEHTARVVAARCFQMWLAARDAKCGNIGVSENMQFRQNGCKLEYSIDCTNWLTLYDPTDCINDIVAHSSTPNSLAEGECVSYSRTTEANAIFICPTFVTAGYIITVTKCVGAAADGLLPIYRCPTGGLFSPLGCDDESLVGFTTDPADPDQPHMSYVARIGDLWFPAWEGQEFTVPDTVPALTLLEFLRNDDALSDNSGDTHIEFTICRPAGVGSGTGLSVVPVVTDSTTVTHLGGLTFGIHVGYNNDPVGESSPRTRCVIASQAADQTGEDYTQCYWHIDAMTPEITAAAGYTNTGEVHTNTDGTVGSGGGVPNPVSPNWQEWFNSTYDGVPVTVLDIRDSIALTAIDVIVTLTRIE